MKKKCYSKKRKTKIRIRKNELFQFWNELDVSIIAESFGCEFFRQGEYDGSSCYVVITHYPHNPEFDKVFRCYSIYTALDVLLNFS